MPETPDWSASPQAVVNSQANGWQVPAAGMLQTAGLAQAGRRLIVAGLDLGAGLVSDQTYMLRGFARLRLFDANLGIVLADMAISPESPYATNRPPFGSIRTDVGADVQFSFEVQAGIGSAFVTTILYWYVE